jgi:rubredoxin
MTEPTRLNYHDTYSCPVCRHGKIAALTLMEAYACNFCQHIFTANLEQQVLKMADSQLPLTWYWNGKYWQGLPREGMEMAGFYLIIGLGFVILFYHLYKLYLRVMNKQVPWVNAIHIFVVAPLLLFIGYNRDNTPRYAYELLLMLGFASFGYHGMYILEDMGFWGEKNDK